MSTSSRPACASSCARRLPVADVGDRQLMTGLRRIAEIHTGEFRLTPNQNVIVANVEEDRKAGIDALVNEHGLNHERSASSLRLSSLSCVAFPTCGLAMAESERSRRRADHATHDGLPERLCPALRLGDRPYRQGARALQPAPRRRPRG